MSMSIHYGKYLSEIINSACPQDVDTSHMLSDFLLRKPEDHAKGNFKWLTINLS